MSGAEKVFLNGEIVDASRALIPVDDRVVLFGDGLFETVRAYGGRPFRLDRHLERLDHACRVLRFEPLMTGAEIRSAAESLLAANGLDDAGRDARVRITLTGGPSAGPLDLRRPGPTGVFILARPYEGLPDAKYREGINVVISGIRRNTSSPLSWLKSTNHLESLAARQEASDRGAEDALLLTTAGNLAEATTSNLFFAKEEELLTPNIGCGFLPGVTRETVIELCGDLGITCTPVMAGPEELRAADEVFLTSSMVEILPVRAVGGSPVSVRCPGPVTARLMEAYRELVEREPGNDGPRSGSRRDG